MTGKGWGTGHKPGYLIELACEAKLVYGYIPSNWNVHIEILISTREYNNFLGLTDSLSSLTPPFPLGHTSSSYPHI